MSEKYKFVDPQGTYFVTTYASGGSLQTTTDYAGGFVYENGALSMFSSPEGRVSNLNGPNLAASQADGSNASAFTTYNITKSAVTQNGETYIKCTSPTGGGPGLYTGSNLPVKASTRYLFRVKGYVQNTTTPPLLYVGTNIGSSVWSSSGPTLPVGSANEDWVTAEFTTQTGANIVSMGVFWWSTADSGAEFYINDVELREIAPEYQYAIADH